eukprot:6879885-Prorocentrum_lima.AAC.1
MTLPIHDAKDMPAGHSLHGERVNMAETKTPSFGITHGRYAQHCGQAQLLLLMDGTTLGGARRS